MPSIPGGRDSSQFVSVVIPAYNAAATIEATLLSVRRQTHVRIEIIVVNDGSTDATSEIAQAHARADHRIRIVETANAGVASARNTGVAAARAELIAPIDADDLWSPTKLQLQLDALARAGSQTGFVYAGHRRIDMQDVVRRSPPIHRVDGRGFLRSVFRNFVGNGSAMLLRREAFDKAGGYEPGLRKLGLEGAEDVLLQIAMARHWSIACVPCYLVGYRLTPAAMSRDSVRMLRSQLAVLDIVLERFPEVPEWVLRASRADLQARLAMACAARGMIGVSLRAALRGLLDQPLCALDRFYTMAQLGVSGAERQANAAPGRMPARASGPLFYELHPRDGLSFRGARPNGWMISRLAAAERDFAGGHVPGLQKPSRTSHPTAK